MREALGQSNMRDFKINGAEETEEYYTPYDEFGLCVPFSTLCGTKQVTSTCASYGVGTYLSKYM